MSIHTHTHICFYMISVCLLFVFFSSRSGTKVQKLASTITQSDVHFIYKAPHFIFPNWPTEAAPPLLPFPALAQSRKIETIH